MARRAIKLAALITVAQQAREYAQKNPAQVNAALGRLEDTVRSRLHPKYSAHVGKGSQALRSGLGIASAPPRAGSVQDTPPPQY